MSRRGLLIAFVALAMGLTVGLVVENEGRENTLQAFLGIGIGWSFVASGLVAWERQPDNSIGRFMVLAGFVRLGAEFSSGSFEPVLFLAGHVLVLGFWIAIAYVLLVFPGGRLEGKFDRWIIMGAAILAPLRLTWLLLGGDDDTRNLLVGVTPRPQLTRALELAETGLTLVLGALVIAVMVGRWRRASPRMRVALAPVLWAGAAGSILHVLWVADDYLGNPLGEILMVFHDLVLAGISFGFLVGLLRARLARSAVADLVIGLGDSPAPGELETALGNALHDPSLRVAYWLPDEDRYVDARGRSVDLNLREERAVTLIERDGRRIAALLHDPATLEDEQLVRSVSAAAGLQLENERLQAELRAQLEEVDASRARIVEAAQTERRRIERDLHDGTQQRLVSIAMTLGLADSKLSSDPAEAGKLVKDAKSHLSDALQELRDLSQGIHPGILTERGLPAALAELVQGVRMPIVLDVSLSERLPDRVEEAAYYFVSEALTNIVKYSHASKGHVQVERWNGVARISVSDDGLGGAETTRGSGLRGLRDRVEALGGQLIIKSPERGGTVVEADIPCA